MTNGQSIYRYDQYMCTRAVNFRWTGKKFDDVEVDLDQPGLVLKTQLYTLTGVEPERQKIMVKGGLLKDDADLKTLNLKEGMNVMMMGTAGKISEPPKEKTVFLEDLTQEEVSKILKIPAGLVNLGNTCYMNATLQCLRAIPELQLALSYLQSPTSPSSDYNVSASIRALLKTLKESGSAVTPLIFLTVLRSAFAQFAQQEREGVYSQQDAEECWSQIVSALRNSVPGLKQDGQVDGEARFVQQFLSGELTTTLKSAEAPDEEPTIGVEGFESLRINIGAGVSTYLTTDLASSFSEEIEKNSPTLDRTAKYVKTSQISRLPEYLAVNFVRFQWKTSEKVRAKILKKVVFPFSLDMSTFCTPELQAKISPAKLKLKEIEDHIATERKRKEAGRADGTESSSSSSSTKEPTEESTDLTAETLGKEYAEQAEILKSIGVEESLVHDVGSNPTGQYDLVAVLTHVGRSADSGHYIGWARHDKDANGDDQWWKFDDDTVTQVSQDDITKLQGGGDWHSAYICLYRAKKLSKV